MAAMKYLKCSTVALFASAAVIVWGCNDDSSGSEDTTDGVSASTDEGTEASDTATETDGEGEPGGSATDEGGDDPATTDEAASDGPAAGGDATDTEASEPEPVPEEELMPADDDPLTVSDDLEAPTGLTATVRFNGIHLAWTDNSDNEEGFEVEKRVDGDEYAMVTTVDADGTAYHDASATAEGVYWYRVRAVEGDNASEWVAVSATISADEPDPDPDPMQTDTMPPEPDPDPDPMQTDTMPPEPDPDPAGDPSDVSFQDDVVPIFEASCGAATAGCHTRESFQANVGDDCRGWLALENEPLGAVSYVPETLGDSTGCPDMSLYERLTELDAWLCGPPGYPSLDNVAYVTPGDPSSSLLYLILGDDPTAGGNCQKAEGMRTTRMPLEPLPALSDADMATIRVWIEEGAKDN